MPAWTLIVLGIAAVLTAARVIWTKGIKPVAKLITTTDAMLPLLRDLTGVWEQEL
jgi:hypothetical protein